MSDGFFVSAPDPNEAGVLRTRIKRMAPEDGRVVNLYGVKAIKYDEVAGLSVTFVRGGGVGRALRVEDWTPTIETRGAVMGEERKVEPVLSRKEWGAGRAAWSDGYIKATARGLVVSGDEYGHLTALIPAEHAEKAGAYLLRGYFTWDMVDALRADAVELCHPHETMGDNELGARIHALLDLVAAILPPRDMETPE